MALQTEKIFLIVPAGTAELEQIKSSVSKAKAQIVKDMQDATLVVFHKNGPHQILFRVRNLGLPVVRDDYIIDCAKVGVALPKEDYIVGLNEVSLAKKLSTLTAAAAAAPKPATTTTSAKHAAASKPYLDSDDDDENGVKVVPKPPSAAAPATASSSKKSSKASKAEDRKEHVVVEAVLEVATSSKAEPKKGGKGGNNASRSAKEVAPAAPAKNPVEAIINAASAPVVSKKPSTKTKGLAATTAEPTITPASGASPLTPLLPAKPGSADWEVATISPAGTPRLTSGASGKALVTSAASKNSQKSFAYPQVGDVTPVLQSPAKPLATAVDSSTSDGAPVRSVDEIIAEGRASLLAHGGQRGNDPFLDRSDSDDDERYNGEGKGSSARIAARREAFANQRAATLGQGKEPIATADAVEGEVKGTRRGAKRGRVVDTEEPSSKGAKGKAADETQSAVVEARDGKANGKSTSKGAAETVSDATKQQKKLASARPDTDGAKKNPQGGKGSKAQDTTDAESASSSDSTLPDDPLIALSGGHDSREFLKSILEAIHAPYTERVFGRCKKPTYLVVEGDELTPKVLYALAAGIPVLSVSWVYETLEQRNQSGGNGKGTGSSHGAGRQLGAKWAPGVTQQWPMIKIKSHHYHPYYCRALQEDAVEAQKRQQLSATTKTDNIGRTKKGGFTEGHRADDLVRSKRPLILKGRVFCLLGQSKEPSTSVFAELLTLLGADVVRTPNIALGNLTAIIVMFDPEEATFPHRRQALTRSEERSILYLQELLRQSEKHRASGVPLITRQWIIDAVHAHRPLPFAGYHYPKLVLSGTEAEVPVAAASGKTIAAKAKAAPLPTNAGKGSTPKLAPKLVVGSREADDEVDIDELDDASSQKKAKPLVGSLRGSGDAEESIPDGERSPLSDSTGLVPKKEPGPRSCAKSARHQWNTQTLCCSSDDDADAGGGRHPTGSMRASLKTKRRLEIESESEEDEVVVAAKASQNKVPKVTPKVKDTGPVASTSSSSTARKSKVNDSTDKGRNSDFLI